MIGASAGGVEALQAIVAALPHDYPGAIFVVLHVPSDAPSLLASILDRLGGLRAQRAVEGPFRKGHIYVAPPDQHLVLERGRMRVAHGPRENRHRPAIDVLFRSAAMAYGPRVTGVVLTGTLDDGSAGLWSVKNRGGVAVVQDPRDAMFPDMPRNAMDAVTVDYCLPLREIAPALVRIANEPLLSVATQPDVKMELEVNMASQTTATMDQLDRLGARSELTCPECGGALWEMQQPPPRFRCHVGHAYSLRTLIAAQGDRVESALWAGLRGIEESEALAQRLRDSARERGHEHSVRLYEERLVEHKRNAETLREILRVLPGEAVSDEPPSAQGTG
ncbi:MAG TPA: chemotaxis protein CheB [Casimicrobiaceae bacterium]